MTTSTPTALILGGSSGMGLATAKRLLERSVGVHLVARDQRRLGAARDRLAGGPAVETTSLVLTATSFRAHPVFVAFVARDLTASLRGSSRARDCQSAGAPLPGGDVPRATGPVLWRSHTQTRPGDHANP